MYCLGTEPPILSPEPAHGITTPTSNSTILYTFLNQKTFLLIILVNSKRVKTKKYLVNAEGNATKSMFLRTFDILKPTAECKYSGR